MTQIEIIGDAVFQAIRATGRYRAEEQKAAMAIVAKAVEADDLVDSVSRLGNISADRQELEKAGIIPASDHKDNALAVQVKLAAKAAGVSLPIKS